MWGFLPGRLHSELVPLKSPQISKNFLSNSPFPPSPAGRLEHPDDHHNHDGRHDHDGRHGHGGLGDHGGHVDQCGHVDHGDHGVHVHGQDRQNCHLNLTFQVTCEGQLSQFLRCLFKHYSVFNILFTC